MPLDLERNRCDKVKDRPVQVRKIKPTRRSVSGYHAFRGHTSIAYESTLERDFLIRCEFQCSVLDVIPQPVAIPFISSNGRQFTYTPDFLVYYRLGSRSHVRYPKPLLVEVKPGAEWREHWRDWFPKWKAARRHAHSQGWGFKIYDESRIRDDVLRAIRFLERYARMTFDREDTDQIAQCVSLMGSCTVDYLLSRFFPGIYREKGLALIWHLVAIRKLDCDVTAPLSEMTELWEAPDEGCV